MRLTGQTTRQANEYVETLLQNIGKAIQIIDHSGIDSGHARLADIIIRRLFQEHHLHPENLEYNAYMRPVIIKIKESYEIPIYSKEVRG